MYLGYLLYARLDGKSVSRFVLLQSLVCAVGLAFALTNSGNKNRYEAEMLKWFPGHDALSALEKISIGFSATLNYFTLAPNVIFTIFLLLLSAGIFIKYRSPVQRAVSLTPIAVSAASLAFILLDFFMADGGFTLRNPRDIICSYGIPGWQSGPRLYIPHILYAAMACSVTACLYLLFRNTGKFALVFHTLLLGIASRTMLGFSPTVFASSYRTYLLLNISFIIAAVLVYREILGAAKPRTMFCINALMILAALANFLAIPIGYEIVKPFFGRP